MKKIGVMILNEDLKPGMVLTLDGGVRVIVGHMNSLGGKSGHCPYSNLKAVVTQAEQLQIPSRDSPDWKPVPVIRGSEHRALLDMALFFGDVKPGTACLIRSPDGSERIEVLGNINVFGGVCDADESDSEDVITHTAQLSSGGFAP